MLFQQFDYSQLTSMKRCNRFQTNTNPYVEFNFEKSLRKYEQNPIKRIKTDHSRPHIHHPSENRPSPLKQIKIPVQNAPLKEGKGKETIKNDNFEANAQEMKEENIIEVAKHTQVDDIFEREEEKKGLIASIRPVERENAISVKKVDGLATIEAKAQQLFESPDYSPLLQPDHSEEIELMPSFRSELDAAQLLPSHKNDSSPVAALSSYVSGGRFNLSSKIYISKRSLQRLAKNQNQECILDELLKKRAYLEGEREEIASRLKEFMKFQ